MVFRNVFVYACGIAASITLFFLSIYFYAVPYTVEHAGSEIRVQMYGKTLRFPNEKGEGIAVQSDPHSRHTVEQYLIPDTGLVGTLTQLVTHVSRNDARGLSYPQTPGTIQKYLHFNPYRAAIYISGITSHYIEINLPESKIEPYDSDGPQRLDIITVWPPWGRLLTMPLVSAAAVALFIVSFVGIFPKRKSTTGAAKRPLTRRTHTLIIAAMFVCGAVAASLICILLYRTMPGFGDEMNYLLQAKIFASGHLSIAQPLFRKSFEVSWMDMFGTDGRIWNFHGIGNSIILMIGWFTGVPWITIPLVGGLIIVVQYCIAYRLFKSVVLSFLHVVFMLTSHYFLTLTGSYMSHAPSLLFISLFFLCVIRVIQDRNDAFLIPAAASIAFAFDIRPISAVLSAIIPIVALVIHWYRLRRVKIWYLVAALAMGLLICSLSYIYTYALTGKFELAYLIKGPETGRTISERWKEGWLYRMRNLYQNMNEFQNRVHSGTYLFNYMLFFVPLVVWKSEKRKPLLAAGYAAFVLYVVLHSFLHFYGWKWEPRMLYDISFIFFLISAYGAGKLYAIARERRWARTVLFMTGIAYLLFICVVDLPYRFTVEYANYSVSPPNIRDYIAKNKIHNAIVFFDNEDLYAPYTPFNALDFNGDIIYAVAQKNEKDILLIAAHPDRKVYYTRDSLTLEPYTDAVANPSAYAPLK